MNDLIYRLAVAGVRQLVPYQPGKPIEELQRELGLSEIIKLASNENPLGPSPSAVAAMQLALSELALYPDGSGYRLKQALAAKFNVTPEQITLGNGSNELLELVARAFLTPELSVVYSEHAFAVYPLVTQAVGATGIVATAKAYGHDLTAMRQAITDNTRLVFIANPNNPTGSLLPQAEVKAFIADLPETVLCVLDEAYVEFVGGNPAEDSVLWLADFPNLIITRTFSKAYGLAGLRVGYSLSCPEMADILNRVRQPFNNNSLALVAAEAALSDSEHLQQTLANNRAGMQQFIDGFKTLGLDWLPSAGNFISVALGREGLPVYQALLAKGVIVRPVTNYGMPQHLRISIGKPEQNARCLQALAELLTR
ncbi:histidinol-phosphate transaminase [Methylocucumis oryzae]|uniref:Histidinol-phosphate aminotransferase n=1 Tax=Methylocucumis oryzae TaxID=1632867 RepID=A0A0F3IHW7_9GAMM|nr:histidinol-phosphate transaminase [Methylocucumis oryzae]KJV06395.1 aspartate aminotransferase [Methylocucumis oryzae]